MLCTAMTVGRMCANEQRRWSCYVFSYSMVAGRVQEGAEEEMYVWRYVQEKWMREEVALPAALAQRPPAIQYMYRESRRQQIEPQADAQLGRGEQCPRYRIGSSCLVCRSHMPPTSRHVTMSRYCSAVAIWMSAWHKRRWLQSAAARCGESIQAL